MKIEINVLPDGQKEKIKEEKKIGFALKMAFAFVAVLLLVNCCLVSYARQFLELNIRRRKNRVKRRFRKVPEKKASWKKFFRTQTVQVTNVSKISSNIPNWARVLARISELCPDGIRINQLSADGSQLKISGFSKTRDDFLNFQDKLKTEGFQFPVDISNLVASNDFNFDLEISVPQDYLIRK